MKVGYIIGSLSQGSINRKLVNGLAELASQRTSLELVEIPIGDLALYDRERDEHYPPEAIEFKRRITECDGLLIATPEYNRSIPGVLKNAIDWASRPYGDNALRGKPVAIIGASIGAIGTGIAQQHLRAILGYLDAPTLGQPEAFIEFTDARFDASGSIVDDETREFLGDWLVAFEEWIGRVGRAATIVDRAVVDSEATVSEQVPGTPSDNVTLTELIDALDADGYSAQLLPREGGAVECSNCGTVTAAGDLEITTARRLEGASDPDDMVTVYAAHCPACRAGGTIVIGFGVNASAEEADIHRALATSGG